MKKILLYLQALFYVLAGINHFRKPSFYLPIMPTWLPWHLSLVYASGVCELALGILLLPQTTRRAAAWGIIALLIAIFPANIQMLINFINEHNHYVWVAILRLPLQLLLIWWAWVYTRKVES